MTTDTQTRETRTESPVDVVVEDYATEPVPKRARLPTSSLTVIFLGMAASSYFFLLGGLVVYMVGFVKGLVAMLVSTALNLVFATLGAYVGFKEGLTSDLSSRLYGFGRIGSAITSGVYAVIFIAFISIESAILQQAISMYSSVPVSAIYIILSLMWILFVIFGVRQISLLNKVALPSFIAVLMLILTSSWGPSSWDAVFSFQGGLIPGNIATAINTGLSTLGLSFFLADYTRFAKTSKAAITVAISFAIPSFLLMPLIGALLAVQFGTAMPGVYFVTAGGIVGVIAMALSQIKIQAVNSYSASLALSNISTTVSRFKPSRIFWVIIANMIGAGLLFLNFLDQLPLFIEVAGLVSTAWATVLFADYYVVRGFLHLAPRKMVSPKIIPLANIVGVVSMTASSVLSWVLKPLLPIPALSAIVFGVLFYVMGSIARVKITRMYAAKLQ